MRDARFSGNVRFGFVVARLCRAQPILETLCFNCIINVGKCQILFFVLWIFGGFFLAIVARNKCR